MRKAFAALAVGALAVSAAAPAPLRKEGQGVEALGWLAGAWLEEKSGEWTEERWSPPRGGIMLGTNASGRGDKAAAFEFLRIAADPSGLVSYWASPGGKSAVPFRLISSRSGEAVFENMKNDYPTRIVYRRNGATLMATISGPAGTKPMSWSFRRR